MTATFEVLYTVVGDGPDNRRRVLDALEGSELAPFLAERPEVLQLGNTGDAYPLEGDALGTRIEVWSKWATKRVQRGLQLGGDKVAGFYVDDEWDDDKLGFVLQTLRPLPARVTDFMRAQLEVAKNVFATAAGGRQAAIRALWTLAKWAAPAPEYFLPGQIANANAAELEAGCTHALNNCYFRRVCALGREWPDHPLLAKLAQADADRAAAYHEMARLWEAMPRIAVEQRALPAIHCVQPNIIYQKWPATVSVVDAWMLARGIALTERPMLLWLKAETDVNARHTEWRIKRTAQAMADGARDALATLAASHQEREQA